MRSIQSLLLTCRGLDRVNGGAALRNWQNLQGLASLGPVDVVAIGPSGRQKNVPSVRHYENFPRDGSQQPEGILSRLAGKRWVFSASAHPVINTSFDTRIVRWIAQRCESTDYDVIVVEELILARYVSSLKGLAAVTVFDAHNCESLLNHEMGEVRGASAAAGVLGRAKRRILEKRLEEAETQCARTADVVWVCSANDRDSFHKLKGVEEAVDVIPNSIDTTAYDHADRVREEDDWSSLPLTLVYLGSYSYYPNEQAALELINEVLPAIQARGVEAKLILIGTRPTSAMHAAAEGNPGIEITGAVESIQPFMKDAGIVLLPIRLGSGTRLKILESFASSRPVISTAKGVEGIEASDGQHLVIRDSVEEMAAAAVELWKDRNLRTRICRNARSLVEKHYSLESAGRRIKSSVEKALAAVGGNP